MTTSDDGSSYDDPNASADQAIDDPIDLAGLTAGETPLATPDDGRSGKSLLLATLAGLVVAALGIAIWAVAYQQFEREFVGVSVLIGFTVGWLMRVLAHRSDLPVRIIAVVITAIACVFGTVVAEVAFTASQYDTSFTKLLGDVLPETFTILRKRPVLTLAVYVAALVLAFLSAGPQNKKQQPLVSPVEPIDADPPHPGVDPLDEES